MSRLRFGGFELDADARLWRGDEQVELQPKVADALRIFVTRAGELVTRDELLEALWPGLHVSDDALQQVVRKLRKALGDDPKSPTFLQTELKRGYRFIAPLEPLPLPLPLPLPSPSPKRPRWIPLALVALAAALVSALLVFRSGSAHPRLGPCTSRRLTLTPEREQEGTFVDRSIIFVANDPDEGQYDLYLTSDRGEGRLRLTHTPGEEFYPQASPDGQLVLYTRADPDGTLALWVIAPTGGTARLVAPAGVYGTWSPDGTQVAYLHLAPDGTSYLAVRTLATGDERALGDVPPDVTAVAWSPDGSRIAYVDGHTAWVVPVGGGAPRAATPRAEYLRQCAWADRDALVCDGNLRGRSNLWWVPVGGEPRPLTNGSGGLYHPARSARGDLLYTAESKQQAIVLASGERVTATTAVECIDAAADAIAFTDYDPSAGGTEVVVQRLAGGARDVLGPGRCPRLAHDGARVAYLRLEGTTERLWLRDGADSRALAPTDLAPIAAPAWSPDDRWLAVATATGLQRVGLDGTVTRLAPGRFGRAEVSPDGRQIAAARDGVVHLVDATTGTDTATPIAAPYENRPTWTDAGLTLLRSERHAPVLVTYTPAGAEVGRAPITVPPDPSTWGIFEAVPLATGWALVQTRYESDLYLLADCLR